MLIGFGLGNASHLAIVYPSIKGAPLTMAEFESNYQILDNAILANTTLVNGHLADTSNAHAASSIGFTPTGTLGATNVQEAIVEVLNEAGGGGGGVVPDDSVTTAKIVDGTILNVDVNSAAAIAKSKISPTGTWTQAEIPSLDASQITSGQMASARLPFPGPTLGGVIFSGDCPAGQYMKGINTNGTKNCVADISGAGGGGAEPPSVLLNLTSGTSATATGLIPITNGGVTTVSYIYLEVTESISGPTLLHLGVPDDLTRYGSNIPTALGTISLGTTSATALNYFVPTDVVVTAVDGTFTGGQVRLFIDYRARDVSALAGGVAVTSKYLQAAMLEPDGTNCVASSLTLNGGPRSRVITCADQNTSIIYGQTLISEIGGCPVSTLNLSIHLYHATTEAVTFAGAFEAMYRRWGGSDVLNATWGTAITTNVAITTAHEIETATGAVTPNGTCTAGTTMLFWRYVVNATNFSTNAANSRVLGMTVAHP
jgi:hypothetical protein